MNAEELLYEARKQGAVFTVPEPGRVHVEAPKRLPDDLLEQLRRCKAEIVELLITNPATACACDPLPSQAEYAHLAQAGCGPNYQRCGACGYHWQCKFVMAAVVAGFQGRVEQHGRGA